MAAKPRTPIEELQEKLTSAIKENTRAQAEAMKSATVEGAEIRKLKKETAAIEKKSAFLERDLGKELGESLAAPFKSLTSIIPKPLKILASMPIQAAMRGQMAGKASAPRVDPSGTPITEKGPGLLRSAYGEALGREISQRGLVKGTTETIKGIFGKGSKDPGEESLNQIQQSTALTSLRLQRIGEDWLTNIDNVLDAMYHLMAYGPSVYTHDIGVHERLDKILASLGAVDKLDYLEGEIIPDRSRGRSLLGTDPSVPLLGMDPSLPMLPAPSSVPLLEDGTMSNEWGTFLTAATTKGSIFTHDAGLMGKMDEFIELFSKRMSMDSKDSTRGSARLKEDEASDRAKDKREGKATSGWRSKLLGMFGKGAGAGGVMGWLGGKAKAGLGKGIGVAGKWIGGGLGALGTAKAGAAVLGAKAAGAAAAGKAGAVALGGKAAAATAGVGAGTIAAAVLLPLAAAAMTLKDTSEAFSKNASAEDRWLKKKENMGGAIGGGVGMAGGAAAGAAIGTFVFPVIGTLIGGLIGAGVGGILGNLIGESIGKSLDKAIDKKTRAQLTALAQEFDELTEERKKINAAEMDLVTKKQLLLQNEARQLELERQAALVTEREQKIKKAEAARLRYLTHSNNIELHKQYEDMYNHTNAEGEFIKGQGKKADSYRDLVDEIRQMEDEKIRLDKLYHETYINQGKEAADAIALQSGIVEEDLAKATATLTKLDMGAPVQSMNIMMYEIQKKFAAADNALDTVDIKGWALFDEEEQLAEIVALQKKIERGDTLTKDEEKVAKEWNEARNKHFDQLKGTAKDKEDEANRLKAEREKGEGVDVDWGAVLSDMEKPWQKTWRTPSGDQADFHQAGESEADYRKRIGAPTSGVTGGGIAGAMPISGITTALPPAAGTTYAQGAAQKAALTDSTKAFGGYSDKPLWEQSAAGVVSREVNNQLLYTTYLDEEMVKVHELHELKMANLDKQIAAAGLDFDERKRIGKEKRERAG